MTSASTFSEQAKRPSADQPSPSTSQEEIKRLPERPAPKTAESFYLHGEEPVNGQVIVINSQTSLQQIANHSISNMRTELGGVLLGHAYRQNHDLIVDVKAAIPAVTSDQGPIHFTFTADAWRQIHQDREKAHPHLDVVGWFHTHPGLGVFYSSDDVVVHSAAFTLPWHVGLVVDPLRNEACYFGWVNGKLAPLAGFYELVDVHEKPVVSWRVVRSSVWHESEMEIIAAQAEVNSAATGHIDTSSEDAWLPLPSILARHRLTMGIIGVLVGFFLLIGVFTLDRRVKQLENLALTLANQALADTNVVMCPDPQLRILTPISGDVFSLGSRIGFVGTADQPEAVRYQIETRPVGVETWELVGIKRQNTSLGTLTRWDTTEAIPALYEVRLTAVDRNNIRLPNTAVCTIHIELIP